MAEKFLLAALMLTTILAVGSIFVLTVLRVIEERRDIADTQWLQMTQSRAQTPWVDSPADGSNASMVGPRFDDRSTTE
ncbi:MAG: hypothetical protein ACQSGP_24795 [Frankia sp.]